MTGVVTVDGAGSTWTNGKSLWVGNEGIGTLDITGGGAVSSGYYDSIYTYYHSYIGAEAGSTGIVTVNGAGSTLTNHTSLYVGDWGNGTLNITGGGNVSSVYYGYIGTKSGSTGEVTVDGAGSTWDISGDFYGKGGLHVGDSGSGVLNIANGGAVTVEKDTWVAANSGSSGVINFTNGTLTTGGFIFASNDLTGTGTVNTGGLVSDFDLIFDATHGLNQTFNANNNPGQNITVNLSVNGSGSIGVGHSGAGTMSISDGIVVGSTKGYLGYKPGSTGTATINGVGSTWITTGWLYVGKEGSGILNITGGGTVNSGSGNIGYESGATGEVTITGTGSTWANEYLSVGYEGNGTLNITDGAVVNTNNSGSVGSGSGGTGEVTVDGSGSTWTGTGSFGVGNGYGGGNGVLNIINGGMVSSRWGYVGFGNGTGVVTIDGIGSTWTNSESFSIGSSDGVVGTSSGTLNITNGGALSTGWAYIGKDFGTGVVTVDGAGSTWTNSDYLGIGQGSSGSAVGNGTLNITNGGAVSCVYGHIGFDTMGEITVDGIGSTWTSSTYIILGDAGFTGFASGVLNITGGGVVSCSGGAIGVEIGATGVVTVDGAGSTWTMSNDLILSYVWIDYPGSGMLDIANGGLVSVAGILTIDSFAEGNSFINMATGGMLALYDLADASASLSTFLGLVEGTDAIRYWDYPLGDWADIAGGTLGEDYTLSYITTPGADLLGYTVLTVLEVDLLPGDANRDGVVSAGDYASVQANFGNTGDPGILGDANGDGVVSASDYASVQANFGSSAAVAEISSTPEPATLSLLALSGVALIRRKRK